MKKILALCLVVVLAVTAVTGATLAYFTDKDADVNVMVAGNVKIVQNETDREGNAWQEDSIAELLPAVYLKKDAEGNYTIPYTPATTTEGPGGYGPQIVDGEEMWYTGTMKDTDNDGELKIYDHNIENEVDKVISVTNRGTLPAYVRTIILIENGADNAICDKLHVLYSNSDGQGMQWLPTEGCVTVDGVTYSVAVCTYNTAVEPTKTTAPSLMQLFLDPSADNDWYDLLRDGRLNIIAFSQAVQTTGFDSAAQALNSAFGEVTAANVTTWINESDLVIKTTGAENKIGGAATGTQTITGALAVLDPAE